jgi:GWxTD domain-containing protein
MLCLFLSALTAFQAPAGETVKDLPRLLERWPDQYVRWIITDAERNAYRALVTDEARLDFIERFWARRDPTPETPLNELRRDYLERFAYVLNHFGAGKPGWATDRGRIYLLLGPPHSVQRNPMGRYSLERPSEIWTYNNLPVPGVPASLDIHFVDFRGTGDFEMVSDLESTAPVAMQFGTAESPLLAWSLRRRYLGMVDPRTGLDTFKEVDASIITQRELDLQQQIREIGEAPKRALRSLDEVVEARVSFARLSLEATAGLLYTDGDAFRVPVSLAVPYAELASRREAGKILFDVDYLIRLLDEGGNEAGRVEDRLSLSFPEDQASKAASLKLALEENLEARPGAYRLQVVLRDNTGEKLGTFEQPFEVRARKPDTLELSSLFVAGALVDSVPGSSGPFQFGTIRVIPSHDRSFAADQELGLYLQAYGAVPKEDGRRRLKVDFFVMKEGRLFLGVPSATVFPDTEPAGIRASIPLGKCPPGDYVIRVRVSDQVSGQTAEREATFRVVAAPVAAR